MENDFCQNHLYYNYNMLITYFIKDVDYGSGMEWGWLHPGRAAELRSRLSLLPSCRLPPTGYLSLHSPPALLPLTHPGFAVIPGHQIFPLISFGGPMAAPLQKQLSWGVPGGKAWREELSGCQLEGHFHCFFLRLAF